MNDGIESLSPARPAFRASGRVADELGPMLRLALPVVVAELGWMAMGIVDTILVGPLGAEATGAVGLGSNLYMASAIFGMGLLLGLDQMVSHAHGAGDEELARRSLTQGVWLAIGLTPVLMLLVRGVATLLPGWGINPIVLRETLPYLAAIAWGTGPLMLYGAARRYLQGVGRVRPVTFALVTANLVNAGVAWLLINGYGGMPRLGVTGSGWATTLARVYLAAVLVGTYLWYRPAGLGWSWPRFEPKLMGRLLQLGWPAAVQVTLEVGVFATATALAGKLAATDLAAHQITLNVSSLTFMVPLGVASAGAVRVGQALGRKDPRGAAASGWTALAIGLGFMACSGVTLLVFARPIIALFTRDPAATAASIRLFYLAAAFQLFDGVQVVATGVLRGAGDTRSPMLTNLVAHWGIGLPLGYALGFGLGGGIVGLWVGLSIGLVIAGLVNLWIWSRAARAIATRATGDWPEVNPSAIAH